MPNSSPHPKQVRLVSVKAERPNHPSRCHQGGQPARGGSALWGVSQLGGPPRRHVHDSIRPIWLAVALGIGRNVAGERLSNSARCNVARIQLGKRFFVFSTEISVEVAENVSAFVCFKLSQQLMREVSPFSLLENRTCEAWNQIRFAILLGGEKLR